MSENASPTPFERTQTQNQPPVMPSLGDLPTQVPVERSVGDLPTLLPGIEPAPRMGGESVHAIPGYDIVKKLGGGGMGIVYLAKQIALNRQVALKVIRAEQASNLDLARFAIEAEASARVKHANIAQVFDYNAGTDDSRPYIAMEFCSGGNLAEFLDRQPQPPARAAAMAETLARAVQAAHEAGIIHRDLKPMNVLLELPVVSDGESKKGISSSTDKPAEVTKRSFSVDLLKITDFGLAKKLDSLDGMTQTQSVMGTPSYMAPEQASGHAKQAGPGTDIWALGVILYEMLTGSLPFVGANSFEVISQVMKTDPVPPSAKVKVPPDLETICLKCLRKDPKDRYASAKDLADDLSAFREGRSISARPMTVAEKSVRWVKKNPSWAGMIAAVAASMILGTGVSLWQANRAGREAENATRESAKAVQEAERADAEARTARERERAAEAEKQRAQLAERAAEEAREKADETLYATRINLARREWLHGISYSARDFLAQAPPARRGWEYEFLRGLFASERHVLRSSVQPHFVAGSADGSLIASCSSAAQDPNLHLWDAATGLEIGTVPGLNQPSLPHFAPRGRKLACIVRPSICLIDADTRRVLWKSDGLDSPVVALAWSADGLQLHTVTLDGQYRRIDAASGRIGSPAPFKVKVHPLTPQLLAIGFQPVFSPDGRYLAIFDDGDDSVKLWDLTDGKVVHSFKDHDRFVGQLAFSPDGKLLASPGGEGTIVVREVPSGRIVHRLRGHKSWVWCTAFSPDGRYLASGSKDTSVRLWDAVTGETIQVYHGHLSEVFGLGFVGSALATYGPEATIRVWDGTDPVLYAAHALEHAKKGGLPLLGHSDEADGLVLMHHGTPVADIAFSPDGLRIATSAHDDNDAPFQVIVRDLVTRRESCRIATPPAAERDLAFSADGKFLGVLLHAESGKKSKTELRVYDSTTGQLSWSKAGLNAAGTALAVHPVTGHFEAQFNTGDGGSTLVDFDPVSGKEGRRLKLDPAIVQPHYLEGGRKLFGAQPGAQPGDYRIYEFEPGTGAVIRSWATGYPTLTASAAARRFLATAHTTTGGPAVIVLWDAATGQAIHKLEGSVGSVLGLAFSPDGKRLLSCGSDFAARVWDTASGRELLTLSGHGDVARRGAWSPDGGRIATASMDGAVRVWSAEGGGGLPDLEAWELLSPPAGSEPDPKQFLDGQHGDWRLEGGEITGTLRDMPKLNFAIAHAKLPTIDLPRTVDIQCRVRVSRNMLVAITLGNPIRALSYTPFVEGTAYPFGPGARLLIADAKNSASPQFSLQGIVRPFELEANRPYLFRVLRQERRLRLFVDGRELVDENIPKIELSELTLQGSWSTAGDEIRFAGLAVRAPAAAVRERRKLAKLERIYAEELLPEPVRARLEADGSLSDAERKEMLAALAGMPADVAALRKSANTLAKKAAATPGELERARRQIRAVVEMSGVPPDQPAADTAEELGTLVVVEHRLGHARAAAEVLFPLLDFALRRRGYLNPEELALAALVENSRGRGESAGRYLRRLLDIGRPEAKWGKSDQPLVAEAKELAGRLLTPAPDIEALKEAYLKIENAGWQRKDAGAYFAGRTPDCRDVEQRDERPGPHDLKLSKEALRARRTLEFQEIDADKSRFVSDEWDIRIAGDRADVSYVQAVVVAESWTGRWSVTAQLERVGGEWKIAGTRSRQTHRSEGNQLVELNAAYWAKKDDAVAEAKGDSEKLDALADAQRYAEAFELGRKVVAGEKANGQDWFNYSKSAKNLGEAAEAIRAAKKAHELLPKLAPLPAWAK